MSWSMAAILRHSMSSAVHAMISAVRTENAVTLTEWRSVYWSRAWMEVTSARKVSAMFV